LGGFLIFCSFIARGELHVQNSFPGNDCQPQIVDGG